MDEIIEILSLFNRVERAISLNEIEAGLDYLSLEKRTLQRYLKKLIEFNRIRKIGAASKTTYWKKDVREAYAKNYRLLFVYRKEEVAGYLFFNAREFVFCYSDEYLIGKGLPLPGLPLSISSYAFQTLPAVFDENLPEGINRELLERQLKSGDDFDLLPHLEHNIGDIYFTPHSKSRASARQQQPSFLSYADEILGKNDFPSILDKDTIALEECEIFPEVSEKEEVASTADISGISGFQYKLILSYDSDQKRFHKEGDGIRNYIFKPYSPLKANPDSQYYLPHLALNEHLFMSFAKNELGLRVPESHLIRRSQDREFHYLVKRFDRLGAYRFAKANFSTFLGLRAENKYETTSEKMFKRIAKELIHPNERMMLLKFYFYSMLISHEDMHTKNLSLLYDKGIVLMAPLYDIACTGIYSNMRGYDTHLTINGRRTKIRPKDFRPLTKILDIPFGNFLREARTIAKIYADRIPDYVAKIRQIGPLDFYKMKQVKKAGFETCWKKGDRKEFADFLEEFWQKRVKQLEEYGWIDTTS